MSRGMFGVARDFRKTHGEDAFNNLARTVFAQADLDGSGAIDTSELFTCLTKLGMKLSDEELIEVLDRYDDDGNGLLDEMEWLNVVRDLLEGSFVGMDTSLQAPATAEEELAQLRAEVQTLRSENKALFTRVEILEAQQKRIEGLAMDSLAKVGLSAGSSAPMTPRSKHEAPKEGVPSAAPLKSAGRRMPALDERFAQGGKEIRKTCPTCGHSWLDKYGKDECPKCLQPLLASVPQREPGEAALNKANAASAMESESGECPKGGMHLWRFGKCTKCGKGEGQAVAERKVGGECPKGGKHIFKFAKCQKCGVNELAGR